MSNHGSDVAGPRPGLQPALVLLTQAYITLCANISVPHRFLEFCKENGGYTGCPFPAKLDLQNGQNLLQDLSKLSPSTSGPHGHDYLPQERESEGGLSLQVEPEWRNEL